MFLRLAWAAASLLAVLAHHIVLAACIAGSVVIVWALVLWIAGLFDQNSSLIALAGLGGFAATLWLLTTAWRALLFAAKDPYPGHSAQSLGLEPLVELVRGVEMALRDRGYPVRPFHTIDVVLDVRAVTTSHWGRRRLILGWALIRMLGRRELEAVVAHEIAHHMNGSISFYWALGRIVTSIQRWHERFLGGSQELQLEARESALGRVAEAGHVLGMVGALLPFGVLYVIKLGLQKLVWRHAHAFEHECDRIAAEAISAEAMGGALVRVHHSGVEWASTALRWESDEEFWASYDRARVDDPASSSDLAWWRVRATPTHPSLDQRLHRLGVGPQPAPEPPFLPEGDRSRIDAQLDWVAKNASAPLRDAFERSAAVLDLGVMLRGDDDDANAREDVVRRACTLIFTLAEDWNSARTLMLERLADESFHSQPAALVKLTLEYVDSWMVHRSQIGFVARTTWASERILLDADRTAIESGISVSALAKILRRVSSLIGPEAMRDYAMVDVEVRASLFAFE